MAVTKLIEGTQSTKFVFVCFFCFFWGGGGLKERVALLKNCGFEGRGGGGGWLNRAFTVCFLLQGGCIFVSLLLHYLYLALFNWMLVEGLSLYFKVVRVFHGAVRTLWYFVFAWGEFFPFRSFALTLFEKLTSNNQYKWKAMGTASMKSAVTVIMTATTMMMMMMIVLLVLYWDVSVSCFSPGSPLVIVVLSLIIASSSDAGIQSYVNGTRCVIQD